MDTFPGTIGWVVFFAIAGALIVGDLLLTRRSHTVGYREALVLTIITTAIGLGLSVWVFVGGGTQLGVEYLSAYIAERALSIDNVFVFLIIFSSFKVPAEHQPRALMFGILGALVARGAFILIGSALITAFSWVLFILGGFLVYTAYKIWPDTLQIIKSTKKYIPASILLVSSLTVALAYLVFALTDSALAFWATWLALIGGAIVAYNLYRIIAHPPAKEQSAGDTEDESAVIKLAKKTIPFTEEYDGGKWFTRLNGKLVATPLFLVIIALIITDILFAVDSIPTVFGISSHLFIVWSSNVMAVLGMRPMYFLIAELVKGFRFLHHGLALILLFVGAKIILNESLHAFTDTDLEHIIGINATIESFISLGVIIIILIGSIALSALLPKKDTPASI